MQLQGEMSNRFNFYQFGQALMIRLFKRAQLTLRK